MIDWDLLDAIADECGGYPIAIGVTVALVVGFIWVAIYR